MAPPSESKLLERLARVQALHNRATTEGERVAAAHARDRLVNRIQRLRLADPVARHVKEYVARLGVPGAPQRPPDPMPSRRTILTALANWEEGTWTRRELHTWAARLVDRVDFPERSDEVGAVRSDVLLQLSAMHRIPLHPDDVPRIRRFLRDRDWGPWFELLTEAAKRRR